MQIKFLRPFFCLCALILTTLIFNACQKELSDDTINPSFDLPITIEGVVTGPNGIPLQNVTIKAGQVQVVTDVNGSFRTTDARFSTSETFVTASKSGFFNGSRTFYPRANSNNFLRIQLLPRTEAASLNASTGGVANMGSSSVTFPANAFANLDGSPYLGTVSVKVAYLDPTGPFINQQMPGDLRGIRATGEMRGLKSFGMMNVELEGAAGQKLQLKSGTSAQLSMPVPSSLSASAPASVPLWYFDEATGLWKEEGTAQKTGNRYTGSVSHFTFWNVDEPFQFVNLEMKIINQAQIGIQGARVELTSLADSSSTYDYTDMAGFVDGFVPINVQLRRDIYNECNGLISSTVIGPFAVNTNLGNVPVISLANQQTISGTVTNCLNLPLASGYVIINLTGNTVYANVTNGAFNTTFTSCSALGGTASIIAVDSANMQQGTAVNVVLSSAVVAAGILQACGTATDEFITITVDNVTRTWNGAPHDLYAEEDSTTQSGFSNMFLGAYDTSNGGAVDIILYRSEDSTNAPFLVGIQSISIFDQLAAPNMLGDYFLDNSISPIPKATISQWGTVGQFFVGNFTASFIKSYPPNVDTVNVSCNFKLRRQ